MSTKADDKAELDEVKPLRLRLQFTAWLVLLGSFIIFCVIAYSIVTFVTDFFSRSVQKQTATLQVPKAQTVFIRRNGQTPDIKASDGDTVNMGDVIVTDKESKVKLQLFDGTLIEISPNSQLELKDSRIVTSNFVRREKNLIIGLNTVGGAENQSAQITVRPVPTGEGDYVGLPVKVIIPNGTQIIFDDPNRGGIFTLSLERDGEGDPRAVVQAASNSRATAKISAAGQERVINAGQRLAVEDGQSPVALPDLFKQYIVNGAFLNGLDYWQATQKPSLPSTRVIGTLIVDAEKIEDGSHNRVHISRVAPEGTLPLQDNVENSLTQDFGNTALFDYTSLEFSVKMRIKRQSLAGGGESGYEYPIFVKLNYIDQDGIPREYFRGFYFRPNSTNTKTRDNFSEDSSSLRLKEDEWYEFFKSDLGTLPKKPMRLTNLVIGASGHEYEVFFTEISLVAKG